VNKGYLHLYTGNGKGKTTAALGLTFRAVGAGKKILFVQFLKNATSSEHTALKQYSDKITVRCYGTGEFIDGEVKPEQIHATQEGLDEIALMMENQKYDMVILDEIITALNYKMISIEDLLDTIHERPFNVEMVLTGRDAPQIIIDTADLVTEMIEIKHYFHSGIAARKGIEY
jgi:cob(I)alamin adenosyltransferase